MWCFNALQISASGAYRGAVNSCTPVPVRASPRVEGKTPQRRRRRAGNTLQPTDLPERALLSTLMDSEPAQSGVDAAGITTAEVVEVVDEVIELVDGAPVLVARR